MADSAAMLTRREASTPRLRLCVLASLLVNIALKLHSEESKYTSATPRCTCFPPRATSTQVRLVQVQVHLGFASVYLNLDSAYLRGVSGGHLVQLQLKSPSSKSKSPSPTRLRLVGLERSRPSPPPPAVGLIPMFVLRKSFGQLCSNFEPSGQRDKRHEAVCGNET